MKLSLCLVAGLLSLSLHPASAADETTFPAKNPVIKYWIPDIWTNEVDPTDGSVSISSDDERISIVFAELPVEATMELCKRMEQKMVKRLKDAKEAHPAKEQASDGLSGYTASYTGSVEGRQAIMTMILFKDGKDRSILGVVFMADHDTMPKEQDEKLEAFMKSLKSTAK
jgi:hypothetical protein